MDKEQEKNTYYLQKLIERAKEQARSAGITQEGQRLEAQNLSRWSSILTWSSTLITAVSGVIISNEIIFSGMDRSFLGVIIIISAGIGALSKGSKMEEKAEARRMTAAEYGDIRRRATKLAVELETRFIDVENGNRRINEINQQLSQLAKRPATHTIPEALYAFAKAKFLDEHPAYKSDLTETHAGGIVTRKKDSTTRYLLVEAKENPGEWVLPKGHIENQDSLEKTAIREVQEESGVIAHIKKHVKTVSFRTKKELVVCAFFLMEWSDTEDALKHDISREYKWATFEEAMELLQHVESKRVLVEARIQLMEQPNH